MAKVTIEGSLTPSVFLPRGERREVQRTERIDQLIAKGFIVEVNPETDQPEPAPLPDPVKSPGKNASRDDWAAFLEEHDVEYPADGDRGQLIHAWESHQATS